MTKKCGPVPAFQQCVHPVGPVPANTEVRYPRQQADRFSQETQPHGHMHSLNSPGPRTDGGATMRLPRRGVLAGVGAAVVPWPAAAEEAADLARRIAADPLRPQYHLVPRSGVLGDPNGPIYTNGAYHLFYQHSPNPDGSDHRQWGHAVSRDMLHWEHWPAALVPTPGGYDWYGCWTGCAVMDGATPTLIYTAVGRQPQMQALATSSDGLRTWQKLAEPVIEQPPPGIDSIGFRDPVVWRDNGQWSMIVGCGDRAAGPMVLLYRSADLRHWTYAGKLYQERSTAFRTTNGVADGMMWECPDFFPLGNKHVLLTSGRGTRWLIGDYDGMRFHPEREGLLEHGYTYAPRTQLDGGGNRILWAWITEPRPNAVLTAAGWSGAMSLPRQLSIGADGNLATRPAPVVDTLRRAYRRTGPEGLAEALATWRLDGPCGEIRVVARNGITLRLLTPDGQQFTECAYSPDRDTLSAGPFHPPLRLGPDRLITLRLLIDASVVEVYANDSVVVTLRCYPAKLGPLSMTIDLPWAVETLEMWSYAPISADRLAG